MIEITARFTCGDNLEGYVIQQDGVIYRALEAALYDVNILGPLKESGYKIGGYHGNIVSPAGVCIKTLPIDETIIIDEQELISLLSFADIALSESEAAVWFDRVVTFDVIDMKEPKIEIRTRDELLDYLRPYLYNVPKINAQFQDVRPLNSFVAKEALFSIDELSKDKELAQYMHAIANRRKMLSYKSYTRLVDFLKEEKVLKGEWPTPEDLTEAYLAWGVCGIGDNVVQKKRKHGVTARIVSWNENTDEAAKLRYSEMPVIMLSDNEGVLHYRHEDPVDLRDFDCYSDGKFTASDEKGFLRQMNAAEQSKYKYTPIPVMMKDDVTRFYFDYHTPEGFVYEVRIDPGFTVILDCIRPSISIDNKANLISFESFLQVRTIEEDFINIRAVPTENEYMCYTFALAKAHSMIRKRTAKTPYNSSFEAITAEGVSPEAAVRYMARYMAQNPDFSGDDSSMPWFEAYGIYRTGPTEGQIARYNPEGIEWDNLDALADIFEVTRETLTERGEYLAFAKDDASLETKSIREDAVHRPVECMMFCRDAKNGNISTGEYARGKREDARVNVNSLVDVLLTLGTILSGEKELKWETLEAVLADIENCGLIDFKTVAKDRFLALHGYLFDKAKLGSDRAKESCTHLFVSHIFREMSNVEENDRHYAFVSEYYDNGAGSIGEKCNNAWAEILKDAIRATDLSKQDKDIMLEGAAGQIPYILFYLHKGIIKPTVTPDGCYFTKKFRVPITNEVVEITLRLDRARWSLYERLEFYTGYCTLYDYCTMEMSDNNAFNLFCLNAKMTPWRITPKDGYPDIPVYSFGINFSSPQTYALKVEQGVKPAEWWEEINRKKERIDYIESRYLLNELLGTPSEDIMLKYQTAESCETMLQENVVEIMAHYWRRFLLTANAAKAQNKLLTTLRLKSDVIYQHYADLYPTDMRSAENDEFTDLVDRGGNLNWLNLTEIQRSSAKSVTGLLSDGRNLIEPFIIIGEDYEDVRRWYQIILGEFNVPGICMMSGGKLLFRDFNGNMETYDLKNMSIEMLDELASKDILFKLNATRYMCDTSMGRYSITVR